MNKQTHSKRVSLYSVSCVWQWQRNNPASGGVSHLIPRERAAFAPLKKWIYATTCTRTLSLNINNICLVTKHELPMGCSIALAHRAAKTYQAWERGQLFTQVDGLMEGESRGGECRKINEIHIFPHGASKTDQKLTDNLLWLSLLERPISWYSSGYSPVITEHLQGKVGSETDVWMDGPFPGTLWWESLLRFIIRFPEPESAEVISAPRTELLL